MVDKWVGTGCQGTGVSHLGRMRAPCVGSGSEAVWSSFIVSRRSLGAVGWDGRSGRAWSTNKPYRADLRHHVVSESVHNSVRSFLGNGPGDSKKAVPPTLIRSALPTNGESSSLTRAKQPISERRQLSVSQLRLS